MGVTGTDLVFVFGAGAVVYLLEYCRTGYMLCIATSLYSFVISLYITFLSVMKFLLFTGKKKKGKLSKLIGELMVLKMLVGTHEILLKQN